MSWNIKNRVNLRFEAIMESHKEWLEEKLNKILGPVLIQLLTDVDLRDFMLNKNSFPQNIQTIFKAIYADGKIKGIQCVFQGSGAEFAAWCICNKVGKHFDNSTTLLLTPRHFEKLFFGREFGLSTFEILLMELDDAEENQEDSEKETHISCELSKFSESACTPQPLCLTKAAPYLIIGAGLVVGSASYLAFCVAASLAITGFAPATLPSLLVVGLTLALISAAIILYGMHIDFRRTKANKIKETNDNSSQNMFKKNSYGDYKINRPGKSDDLVCHPRRLSKRG